MYGAAAGEGGRRFNQFEATGACSFENSFKVVEQSVPMP